MPRSKSLYDHVGEHHTSEYKDKVMTKFNGLLETVKD